MGVATDLGVIMSRTTASEAYRRAVVELVANCGANVRRLLADNPRFSEPDVCTLARTAPDYQRHVTGRAAAGDPNPLRPVAATLLVYDTVAFREVTSRLHRAAGMVRGEAALLAKAVHQGTPPDRLPDRLLTLDLIAEAASRLSALLAELETVPAAGEPSRLSVQRAAPSPAARLHAAGGLGLIAKNVRNVSVLQTAHRPTPAAKAEAVRLTAEAHRVAVVARDAARRAFGRADDAVRVRPRSRPTRRVITHAAVDGDAVAAAWLAERFLYPGEPVEVLFVPRERALGAWRAGDVLADVGNTHDPANGFFDHKLPAYADRHAACAAGLVWDHLVALGRPVRHLRSLVDVVFAGDSVKARGRYKDEYAESKRGGFHQALTEAKAAHPTDAGVYRAMRRWLDGYHRRTLKAG